MMNPNSISANNAHRLANRTGLIAALDTPSLDRAEAIAKAIAPHTDMLKTGMEYCYGAGLEKTKEIEQILPIFMDLKLYDIPATVKKGMKSLMRYRPSMVTIHASGGAEMVKAAKEGLLEGAKENKAAPPILLAVTVLTSFSAEALSQTGVPLSPLDQAVLLGKLAIKAGADGLVCSGHELARLRQELGKKPVLVTPGIRPLGTDTHDQKRTMTPAEAAKAGADWIVVGRPITQASDPAEAAKDIQEELLNALKTA
ncbi:orotidine 5 -phosphate decarboxylase [Lasius niger]|uniref:Orotidine 5'-phosphate decarboxylase n=1 Tax=Lasius niger TaxID=67767 RepID=A0A0J7KFC7_LASNI|nr:orotidine 5 -phosphate decarboxylase [Lasius niger]